MLQMNIKMIARLMTMPCAIFLIVMTIAVVACQDKESPVLDKINQVHQYVQIGMGIDEAIAELRKQGFTVGDKYKPTQSKDYYQVNVLVREDIPVVESMKYTAGIGSGIKTYVVLRADLSGTITLIE